jgi:hypothetical protein
MSVWANTSWEVGTYPGIDEKLAPDFIVKRHVIDATVEAVH